MKGSQLPAKAWITLLSSPVPRPSNTKLSSSSLKKPLRMACMLPGKLVSRVIVESPTKHIVSIHTGPVEIVVSYKKNQF